MSNEALPLLYLNMSGEMIYIVEQRLTAQNIDTTKAEKVLNDIFTAVFTPALMAEVFKKQRLLSIYAMRQMFEKLAHSSIMKLNEQSMSKLFDLMVMVTKFQMVSANTPLDLLQITLNHLESMCQMTRQPAPLRLIEEAKAMFVAVYLKMSQWRLQHIRCTILVYLQDVKTRVSIFLRDGTQENDGRFVIRAEGVVSCDCQIPGQIKYFSASDQTVIRSESFDPLGRYVVSTQKTSLGLNIYSKEYSQSESSCKEEDSEPNDAQTETNEVDDSDIASSDSVKNELYLLAKLIGRDETNTETGNEFYLSLTADDNDNQRTTHKPSASNKEVLLSGVVHTNRGLDQVMKDLNLSDDREDGGDHSPNDLLDLMDS